MKTPSHVGEGRTRAFCARRSFRMSLFQGEHVAYLALSNGREVMISPEAAKRYIELGFTPSLSADSNGAGRTYPRHMVNDPRPDAGRSRAVTLARTLVAIRLVEAEALANDPAPAKGWVVRHANDDTLDCRDSNLLFVPANGSRNGHRAVWNVRERARLVQDGLDPNRVFAERRREARRKSSGAQSQVDARACVPVVSPRRPPLGSRVGCHGAEAGGAH